MNKILILTLCILSGISQANTIKGHIIAPDRVKKIIVYLQPGKGNTYRPTAITHVIKQKGAKFDPEFITAVPGDKVEWLNNEEKEIDHNIFSLSEIKQFDLGLGEPGSILSESFDHAGILNYYCSVHKTMEGRIAILPSRFLSILDKPGEFTIAGVPTGNWILKAIVYHRRYKAVPASLAITKPITSVTLTIEKK